jgi:hypothetical protein
LTRKRRQLTAAHTFEPGVSSRKLVTAERSLDSSNAPVTPASATKSSPKSKPAFAVAVFRSLPISALKSTSGTARRVLSDGSRVVRRASSRSRSRIEASDCASARVGSSTHTTVIAAASRALMPTP